MQTEGPSLLVLARHGESRRNVLMKGNPFCPTDEIAQVMRRIPDTETPLTEKGWRQGLTLGHTLKNQYGFFDAVYHSGAQRTRSTAEAALRELSNPGPAPLLREDHRIRERDSGYAYAMTREEFNRHFPWMDAYWKHMNWFLARPVGGESVADVWLRVDRALRDISARHHGKHVLLVTHGRVILTVRHMLEQLPTHLERPAIDEPGNCAYVAYRWDATLNQLVLKDSY